jgi:hypothetical protein
MHTLKHSLFVKRCSCLHAQDCKSELYDSNYINFISAVPRSLLEELAHAALEAEAVQQIQKVCVVMYNVLRRGMWARLPCSWLLFRKYSGAKLGLQVCRVHGTDVSRPREPALDKTMLSSMFFWYFAW